MPRYVSRYVSRQDIADAGGELALVFGDLSVAGQDRLLAAAERRVDDLTHQLGGMQAQSAKVLTVLTDWSTNALALPNRPVTAVHALSVSRAGTPTTYPVTSRVSIEDGHILRYVSLIGDSVPAICFLVGDRITVTYDCGYASVPACVSEATLYLLGADLFRLRENARAANQEMIDRDQIQHASQLEIDMQAARILEPVTIAPVPGIVQAAA